MWYPLPNNRETAAPSAIRAQLMVVISFFRGKERSVLWKTVYATVGKIERTCTVEGELRGRNIAFQCSVMNRTRKSKYGFHIHGR